MKTESYNPSPPEVELAKAIVSIKEELNNGLSFHTIIDINADLNHDNPRVHITTKDNDGDNHEFVIKVIQRPDSIKE